MSEALRTAAREAWLYALPLIEIATTRQRGLGRGHRMNALAHIKVLADHRHRAVTTPNNDTLYSTAQIDLSHGPLRIGLPASGERYLSLALMDAYSNNFAVLGTRTTGPDAADFTLVGPAAAAEAGPAVIRSPTDHVWALARIAVYGEADLEAARAVQAGITLEGPQIEPPPESPPRSASWDVYFAGAAALLKTNPPPPTDLAVLRRIAPLGLESFDPSRFSNAEVAAIDEGVAEARALARRGGITGGGYVNGWAYPPGELGVFAQSYLFRARVALGGLAALPLVEAMYMRGQGDLKGALFSGDRGWKMRFAPEAPLPVDSFWSLSLYEATDDGQFFFADNPLHRYAIGDRTEGLVRDVDGGLTIWIGREDPGGERSANWLPAPAEGPFALFMRAYLPRPELLEGRYRLPPVEPV